MNYSFPTLSVKSPVILLFLLTITAATSAQNYWDKIPALTAQHYSEKDDFSKKIDLLKTEIKAKLDRSKQAVEEKASKMTQQERMAIATKMQNMSADEIIKMQNEMMALTAMQTEFQQKSSEFESQYNQLENEFREEFGKKLGPIEQEYQKLPDGEGTPQWAIKKGEELILKYNKEYEALCETYFTSANSKFRLWLQDFNAFLIQHEVPYNQKMLTSQYGQFGLSVDESVSSLMAIERYLEKCLSIAGLRRPYPQG
jgi:hypothetical protein